MTRLTRLLLLTPLLAACASVGRAQDLKPFFKGVDGCFVLYDQKAGRYTRHNEARCRERFSPKSTFKIPNSLVGLEAGVIRDAGFVIPWDKAQYPPDGWDTEPFVHWKRDHDLRSAFKYSVVWYYRELAKRVGPERMHRLVASLDYGNGDTSGDVTRFWLNETLKISADEQVEFLKKFYAYRLPVSRRSTDIVKEIMVQERAADYTLSAKTGGGPRAEGVVIGWYVGYVETRGNVYFFAMNMDGPSYLSIRDRRLQLTRQVLARLGVLPKQ